MNGFITVGKIRLEKKTLLIGMLATAILAGMPIVGDYIDGFFTAIRDRVKSLFANMSASATKVSK